MRALILFFAISMTFAAPADAVTDDIAAAQRVIRSQEQAIGRDDAEAAYALAAPGIKYIFPDATTFLGMVQKNYRAVYRHKSFEFGLSRSVDGVIIQDVQIIDTDGDAWAARYILERQPDGSLKINGCTLMKLVAA